MTELRRGLSVPLVVCSALGTILSAGMDVLVGAVAGEAGREAPRSERKAYPPRGGRFPAIRW